MTVLANVLKDGRMHSQGADKATKIVFSFRLAVGKLMLPRPWFLRRPTQIVRRLRSSLISPRPGFRGYQVAWGGTIIADGTKVIGRSLRTTGIYDLAVTETLYRLLAPGDTAVDAGAHIGYMTVLMAKAVGADGCVTAFEPHPALFDVLRRNVQANGVGGWVHLRNAALGGDMKRAVLAEPNEFTLNDGVCFIRGDDHAEARARSVRLECLDRVVERAPLDVLKLDVEGSEERVLSGGSVAFSEQRIRHVVFEDHIGVNSPVMQMFQKHGYQLFYLRLRGFGVNVVPLRTGSGATLSERPNYLATVDVDHARSVLTRRGWRTLRTLKGDQ